jgi:hypothetical protein
MSRSAHESFRLSTMIEGHGRRGGSETWSPRCYAPTMCKRFSSLALAFPFSYYFLSLGWRVFKNEYV